MSSARSPRRLMFVVNDAAFFASHRLPLAIAARAAGFEVEVATAPNTGEERIRSEGFVFHPLPLGRRSANPITELRSLWALTRLFRERRPDVVHLVTIKPNLYGSLAARFAGVPRVVNAISGLGYVFISHGARAMVRRALVELAYRSAFRHPDKKVIFQNPDDRDAFVGRGLVAPEDVVMIRGSGADIGAFAPTPEPAGEPVVLLASRLLKDKGVLEFVEAARQLHRQETRARFVLVGAIDAGNPSSFTEDEVQSWKAEGAIEAWGRREDMPHVFAQSTVVCLPSYREGLPKVLIEAAACERAIVTTDVPGCREIVAHEENGLLVPARDAVALAAAIRRLLEDSTLRHRLARRGRERAEREFSLEHVVAQTLAVYGSANHFE